MEKAVDAATPFEHRTTVMAERGIAVEQQQVSFHGSTFTHLDALCHIAYQGQLYNGVSFQESVTQADGCTKLAITTFRDGIVTRGILLDIPRLKGVPYLEPGTKVYIEDVEAWEKKAGIKVSAGDAVFLRTGRWARRAKRGRRAGRQHLRQRRSGGAGRDRRAAQSLGVPPDGCSGSRDERHRVAAQSAGGVLTGSSSRFLGEGG